MTGLGLNIACYLFLGGAGGGLCMLASVMALLVPAGAVTAQAHSVNGRNRRSVLNAPRAYRVLLGPLYGCALLLLAVGSLMLLADLGVTNRAILLFELPHPTLITLGAFSLAVCMLLCVALAAAWGLASMHWRCGAVLALEVAGIVVGAMVILYTGFLLSGLRAVPFWATPVLPALFAASAVSCACACASIVAHLSSAAGPFEAVLRRVSALDIVAVLAEAALAAAFVAAAYGNAYAVAAASADELLHGNLSGMFFAGFVGCGIVVPLVLQPVGLALRARGQAVSIVCSAAVLAGGFALRYCIVMAGAHPAVWTTVM